MSKTTELPDKQRVPGDPTPSRETPSAAKANLPALDLSRVLGNQAMGRLLESGGLQTKLRISQPGDADENEADRVAGQIVSRQHAPVLQRNCDCGGSCSKCQEEEGIIHRSVVGRLSSLPLSIQRAAAAGSGVERDASRHPGGHPQVLVVEDDAAKVEPGQMRKQQFIALLQTTACATADAALAAVKHTTKGCPYIKKWLGHYQEKSAQHLMRAMHKYAPETVKARSAHEAISLVNQRVERAALSWAKTGKVSGLPEGIQEEMMGGDGDFAGAVAGFRSSGFGKRLLAFLGGGIHKKSNSGAGSGRAEDAAAVKAQLGSGQSLDGRVRSRMSSAFGYDFSGVRVHTDSKATELSSQLDARAFTIGGDVAFAGGEYKPGTLIGDALIAHELAHVVQQGGGKNGGLPQTKDAGLSDESNLEQDADRSAVGAVVSAWTGVKNGLAVLGANAIPRLKSGLKLQRCKCSSSSSLAARQHTQRSEAITSAQASGLADENAMAQAQADFMRARNDAAARAALGGVVVPTTPQVAAQQSTQVAQTSITPSVSALTPPQVATWTARANTAVATVVTYAAAHHPELGLAASDFHVDVVGVENRGAGVIAYGEVVGGRQVATVGRTFVRYVDANPAYAMSVIVHELHGHPEYGPYGQPGSEYGLELYDKAAAKMPGYVQPVGAGRTSEIDAYAYQETEIYSLLRSLPYHTPLAPADAALQPDYVDPEPTVKARIGLIKSQWEPKVAKALLRGLYQRLLAEPKLTPAALDAFRRAVRANYTGPDAPTANDILR